MLQFRGPRDRMRVHHLLCEKYGEQNGKYQWSLTENPEGDATILVRFTDEPLPVCRVGDLVSIRLPAAPKKQSNGRAVYLLGKGQRVDWFRRVMLNAGIQVLANSIDIQERLNAGLHKWVGGVQQPFSMPWCEFSAEGKIVDVEALHNKLRQNIGKGGSYGLGMLTVN
ncbi:MAG: hypothetical protein DI537_55130 [Stutzerimonas stutzeri]|nr:MAG: hypothetical protein DI537_55130 [Stutzerimonas stutzeri]